MAFKGKYSANWLFRRNGDDPKQTSYDNNPYQDSYLKDVFLKNGFRFHPKAGWISSNEIIYDTGRPLPGMEHLGCMIYSGEDILGKIHGTLTYNCLIHHLVNFFSARGKWEEGYPMEVLSLKVCKHNHAIWLIELKESSDEDGHFHPIVESTIALNDEGDGGNQKNGDESISPVNALDFVELQEEILERDRPISQEGLPHRTM